MKRLNQVLAIEKGVRTESHKKITELHRLTASEQAVSGISRTYQPVDDGGEKLPPESVNVQVRHQDAFSAVKEVMGELMDLQATKDVANCAARAHVRVDGNDILNNVPATHLLFLEKQLEDLRTFVGKMQVLNPSESWTYDGADGLYKTRPAKTHKTKKLQRPLVMYDATTEHPAQTQLVTEDVVVGHWETVKSSGAISLERKRVIEGRIAKLLKAVKEAREMANMIEAPGQVVGEPIFEYLFGE